MREQGPNFVRPPVVTSGTQGWVGQSRSRDRGVAAPQPGYHTKEDS